MQKEVGDHAQETIQPGADHQQAAEAEVMMSQGKTVGEICRTLGISDQTYYRWRREYGGLKTDQAQRLKELEKEDTRLKKLVADLSLDNSILKEALRGK